MASQTHDADRSQNESLAEAIRNGRIECICELIEAGANVNGRIARDFPVMQCAKDETVLRLLLEKGADIEMRSAVGRTWLFYAALSNVDEVEMLLRNGANPNARADDCETPLFSAQHAGRADIAKLLLANGADVDTQRNDGWTALYGAIVGGSYEVVEVLLRAGANTELREEKGNTPLIVAISMHDVSETSAVELLLEYGADVNGVGGSEFRPIHAAAVDGFDDLVRRLAEAGAELNTVTADGDTAVDIAFYGEHASTERLLRDLGGREESSAGLGSGRE